VDDSAGGSQDRAEVGVAGPAETDDLTTDATLLCVKFKGHEVGIKNVGVGGSGEVETLAGKAKRDVLDADWGGFGRTYGVFAGAQEEEETECGHVANRVTAR
jgi:hypothetical protein